MKSHEINILEVLKDAVLKKLQGDLSIGIRKYFQIFELYGEGKIIDYSYIEDLACANVEALKDYMDAIIKQIGTTKEAS